MSAGYLRETAALIRERAKAASAWDGNWQVHESKPGRVVEIKGDDWDDAIIASCVDYGGTENGTEYAAHIAATSPPFMLAVADLLDVVAKDVGTSTLAFHAALDAADAYRGES